jgi:hypothetical protein
MEAQEETEPIMILDPEQEELGKINATGEGIFNSQFVSSCRSESREGWQDRKLGASD